MSTPFDTLLAAPPSGRKVALLLDHTGYGSRRILHGRPVPWTDPVACASYFGQAQGLLQPDATLVDAGAALDQHIVTRADLIREMGARSRTGFALKTLLADEDLAQKLHKLVQVLSETSRQPVVLQVPSPLRWLSRAQRTAGNADLAAIETDHGEAASMYMSDWLRRFDSLPIALLLLDGRNTDPDLKALPDDDLAVYTPLINAARHYRWGLALRTDEHVTRAEDATAGAVVPDIFWSDHGPAPCGVFRIASIPADIEPERVLARLADLG
jgi:vacuolar-type H+-ATPase subunit F/Vma7